MPGVCSGPGGGVISGAPPEPAWGWYRDPMGEHTTTRTSSDLQGLLTQSDRVGRVIHKGLQGVSKKLHEPPDPLHVPPLAGHDSDSRGI